MKKIYLSSLFFALSIAFNAQSFYKDALITEVGTGFEIYNTTLNLRIKDPNRTRDTSYTDKAANTNFGLAAEYGLHKRFGVGFRFKTNKYITSRDSATKIKPDVRTNDFVVVLNYHPIVKKNFDLVLGADVGYSTFKYKANDSLNLILSGGGSYISLYVNPRIYFGKFGINFKLYAPFTNYNSLTTNNDDFNKYIAITKWKGQGFGMGFGIQYRFMKNKEDEKPAPTTN
ncbi:MAG: hypothetical protein Q7W45_18565 [Bacteroidota bacterium]|nr:hypothetical protein [Bacteroidota bacterium]MDP3145646.1 hypothetical protein [Bacteroidota bacterium]MDP3558679.1 hypothetical protein [Bacteroidota bacterium]